MAVSERSANRTRLDTRNRSKRRTRHPSIRFPDALGRRYHRVACSRRAIGMAWPFASNTHGDDACLESGDWSAR
jgi:hypothetical protein